MRRCKYVLMLVVWMLVITVEGSAQIVSNGASGGGTPTGAAFPANAQTSTYQVLASDFAVCKSIPIASGTFTVTLVASTSQPASGQCVLILNYGTGNITVARNGQNINGAAANITLLQGSATAPTSLLVISDGANYVAMGPGGSTFNGLVVGSATQSWFIAGSNGAALAANGYVAWSTQNGNAGFSLDVGLDRDAAGTLGLINGTVGTTAANYRDLKLRHILGSGTAPTITSGFGTTPAIVGGDMGGRLTVGTGGTATTGVITFGTAFTTAPACVANNETTIALVQAVASTTTLTLNASAAFSAGALLTWHCIGY